MFNSIYVSFMKSNHTFFVATAVSLALALGGFFYLFHEPKNISVDAELRDNKNIEKHSLKETSPSVSPQLVSDTSQHTLPQPSSDLLADDGRWQIKGTLVDDKQTPVSGGELLYRFISTLNAEECDARMSEEFMLSEKTQFTHSDPRGEFYIETPQTSLNEVGCVVINASKNGFAAELVSFSSEVDSEVIEIELQPYQQVIGKVLKPDSEPIANADIAVWPVDTGVHDCHSEPNNLRVVGKTSEQGVFTIDLMQGGYCVIARHSQWASSLPQFFIDGQRGVMLNLRQGVTVRGQVTDQFDMPVSTDLFLRHAQNARHSVTIRSDSSGYFNVVGLDYGHYTIEVPDVGLSVYKPQALDVDSQVTENISIQLDKVSLISGRVLLPTGEPAGGASISLYSPTLLSVQENVTAAVDGRFTLVSNHRGKQALYQHAIQRGYSAEPEQSSATGSDLCISAQHPNGVLSGYVVMTRDDGVNIGDLHLSTIAHRYTGRVVNFEGKPIPATIKVTPNQQTGAADSCTENQPPLTVETTVNGEFKFALAKPSAVSIEVSTERYKPRYFEMDLNQATQPLELSLR
ncbi:hypothetical protein NBRC116495_28340 [Aurantivibrio plasticivorans]